jgi:hypothetical protein
VTRVVFVPSSTLVTVSPPSFLTVTVGACAVADGAGVDEAVAGAGVDGAAAGAGAGEAAGAVDAEAGVAVASEAAGVADAEAGVAVAGEAAGVADAEAGVVVAGVLELVGRAGGGDGSAAADPAGVVAPLVPADNDCINCGKSLSASLRWLSAPSGLPVSMSVYPPKRSPTTAMFLGRIALAASLTNAPGSVTTFVTSETMLPMKLLMSAPLVA